MREKPTNTDKTIIFLVPWFIILFLGLFVALIKNNCIGYTASALVC
jgi:hypothetical protein